MDFYCNNCKKDITEKEYYYSVDNFYKPLCRRHQPTPEARELGHLLRKYGWKVEFEKWDGHKHIDIAVVKAKVNIEVDGIQHNFSDKQALSDLERTYYSFLKDYLTLRIPNSLVRNKRMIAKTAEVINEFLNKSEDQLK